MLLETDPLWRRLDALIDAAPGLADLRSHRLEVPAARRFRATGRAIPADFAEQERLAALAAITVRRVLELVAAASARRAIVLKGPEIAALYPDAAMRGYWDVDLLVEDAEGFQQNLVAAGFEPVGDPSIFEGIHHLRPLRPPGLLLPVEVHSRPKWYDQREPPSVDDLFAVARPSVTGVPGMLALPPAHHAIVTAVHSWAHEPLRRLRDLIDVAVLLPTVERDEVDSLAARWGVERIWRTTSAAAGALRGSRPPLVTRVWAQNLRTSRERTVFEDHLQRWLSDFWALPAAQALRLLPRSILHDLHRDGAERWRSKLRRSTLALRHARYPRSRHEVEVEVQAERRRT